jgi:hypothetical protein
MRKFKKVAVLSLGLLVGIAVLGAGSIAVRQHIPDEYIGAERAYLSTEEKQLAEFDSITADRRIALIGSSPVILGLSAEQIETATGIPARNLAMDASRAVFADYAAMVVEHIRPGDVVIIADPNLRKSPQMQLPLRCVRHFGFECMREQTGFAPRIVEDALVLFTDRSFGDEPLARTPRGDFIFSDTPKTIPPKFQAPFPKNGVDNMAKLAGDVRRRGGCPIFVLTPLLPRPEQISLWQNEFTALWRKIDDAGLHDIVVEDSPLWSDPTLFHHDEHPSEPGRKIWTGSVIAKLHEKGLPASCGQVDARSN